MKSDETHIRKGSYGTTKSDLFLFLLLILVLLDSIVLQIVSKPNISKIFIKNCCNSYTLFLVFIQVKQSFFDNENVYIFIFPNENN